MCNYFKNTFSVAKRKEGNIYFTSKNIKPEFSATGTINVNQNVLLRFQTQGDISGEIPEWVKLDLLRMTNSILNQ